MVFAGSGMDLTFVCMGKKSISAESAEYFPNMGFVLRNVVRIDEDVIQIYDDDDVNHVHKNVIHKALKCGGCISKPSGITNHLKELQQVGMQSSIHLQVKSIQDGTHVGNRSWCRLMLFLVHLGGQK